MPFCRRWKYSIVLKHIDSTSSAYRVVMLRGYNPLFDEHLRARCVKLARSELDNL